MTLQDDATWEKLGFDRRQAKRRSFRAPALLRLPDQKIIEAHTIDISTGGICLVTSWRVDVDFVCDIRVRPPIRVEGLDVMLAQGRVVHSVLSGKEQGFVVGLEFTNVPSNAMKIVEQYVGAKLW